jgi:hypothetical protein
MIATAAVEDPTVIRLHSGYTVQRRGPRAGKNPCTTKPVGLIYGTKDHLICYPAIIQDRDVDWLVIALVGHSSVLMLRLKQAVVDPTVIRAACSGYIGAAEAQGQGKPLTNL